MADKPTSGVVRRPAVPSPIRIRRSVLKLPKTDPIITFFSKAIGEMKKAKLSDPVSWRYQAAIHDYPDPDATLAQRRPTATNLDRDPFASDKDLPLPPDRGDSSGSGFWKQCQHGSWFFLPWHRMYLHHFEKIVAGHVLRLGGPIDWALPYWNYSDKSDSKARALPEAFRTATLPDGSENHLFVKERVPDANAGNAFLGDDDVSLDCLKSTAFEDDFGGPKVKHHPLGGSTSGTLENAPHNFVHGAIGGSSGFMNGARTAPLDPIFWVHHCNIDRLWEVWIKRDSAHKNPTDHGWLTEPFKFHDAAGNSVTMKSEDVLDTKKLLYVYEDTSDPIKSTP